jgi:protein TonB
MLIAFFLAIALHLGLMNFEFAPKPILIPTVALPRSVSVFLNQRNMIETPVPQAEKAQTVEPLVKEQPAAEIEPKKPVLQKVSTKKEKTETPLQQPVLFEKTGKQPPVEKSMSASQSSADIEKNLIKDAGAASKAQESATPAEPQAAEENEGVNQPGTLQIAYPRYQLNAPPSYPGLARKRAQEGTVVLQVLVNEKGRVDTLEIESSSGFGLLDRAAVSSVRKWSFEPGRRGEERIPMWVRVPVTFTLNK